MGRASVSMSPIKVGWDQSFFHLFACPITFHRSPAATQHDVSDESSSLSHHVTFRDIFVYDDDSLVIDSPCQPNN